MNWLDKAERRLGHLAIPHLIRYVALLNGLVFVLAQFNPRFLRMLTLDPASIMNGEVWRLVSHIFVPRIGNFFPGVVEAFFYLMFLKWLGDGLEEAMGAFRVNVYYSLGMLGTTLGAFLAHRGDGGFLLNTSLLFAFVWFYPNLQILVLFILPLKVKWLAWVYAGFLVLYFVTASWGEKLCILVSLSNFGFFFVPYWLEANRIRKEVRFRRAAFEEALQEVETLHRCAVCQRTEASDPDMEFRVARDGQEYCSVHLPKP